MKPVRSLGPVRAESTEEATADRQDWTPSVSMAMLAHVQDVSGTANSTFPARDPFEPFVEDEPLVLIPVVPIGVQLKGPSVQLAGHSPAESRSK